MSDDSKCGYYVLVNRCEQIMKKPQTRLDKADAYMDKVLQNLSERIIEALTDAADRRKKR